MTAPAIVAPEVSRRALWLESRKDVMTGTDAGKVLTGKGVDVWLEKTGQAPALNDADLPDYMIAGRYFERPILTWYADRFGVGLEFQDSYQLHRHPLGLAIGATLDAKRAAGDRRPVDAKNIGIRHPYDEDGNGWGRDGSDQMPLYYAAQLVFQMAVTGAPCADLAVVFSGNRFAHFTIERDATVEDELVAKMLAWYETHIVGKTPPPADGSDSYTEYLKKHVRQRSERIVSAPEGFAELMADYIDVNKAVKEMEERKSLLGNQIRSTIGDNVGIVDGAYQATWRQSADGKEVDWERATRILAERYKIEAADVDAVVQDSTVKKFGSRRLLVTQPKTKR